VDVARLRWPEEEAERAVLARARLPRLLLVDAHVEPPGLIDDLEDWIRLPAPEVDVAARVSGLAARSAARLATPPYVDDDDVLHVAELSVALGATQARLARVLAADVGSVVSRNALAAAGWPDGLSGRNALDLHVTRLRRRLRSVGLTIRTERALGYVLVLGDLADLLQG
jgi:DNA-binding response OmpR family regulator